MTTATRRASRILAAVLISAVSTVGVAHATDETDRTRVPDGTALAPGYLRTSGSQFLDSRGNRVRIAAVGWYGQNERDINLPVDVTSPLHGMRANVTAMKRAGFNTVTIGWNDASLHDRDTAAYLAGIDRVVAAAKQAGLKVILNHHVDEGSEGNGNCLAQQANGLWYDRGPGTDGTDGCGTRGTVTRASFARDWAVFARRYAHNATVIGFDLDNEPLAYPGMSTWGDGGPRDIRRMYSEVGSMLESLDPGVLIICEGPQNYSRTFASPNLTAPEGDLTAVPRQPVTITVRGKRISDKTVYSVHEYAHEVSDIRPDSGPAATRRYTAVWGFVVRRGIAPVWIGEAGTEFLDRDDDAWARTLTRYLNGVDAGAGGPSVAGGRRGVSTTWWSWGYHPGDLLATLRADGSLRPKAHAVYAAWQPR